MTTINKEVCPCCGQTINNRKIVLYRGMVESLKDIYVWCRKNNRHEFTRKEIKHALKTDGQIARFGDWVYFGGLMYKGEKGMWGMNIERSEQFLNGKLAIPTVITKNAITKEIIDRQEMKVLWQIKGLSQLLDKDGSYISEYVGQGQLI